MYLYHQILMTLGKPLQHIKHNQGIFNKTLSAKINAWILDFDECPTLRITVDYVDSI